jgi:hypothetical protein
VRSISLSTMARLPSTRFVTLAVMLILAACDTRQAAPTEPSATASPSDMGVPRLASASIAYDPGGRQVLLFGITEGDFKATTWTWDGRSWTEQHPRSSPTELRGSLAYDWVTSSVILFGTTYPDIQSQTWAWKDGNWVRLHPSAEAVEPGGEYFFNLASDARSKQVLAFGGCCGQTELPSKTWSWDGSSWGRLQPKTTPSDRINVHFAYDAAIQRTVLFGGNVHLSGSESNDLWTWDGGAWVNQYPAAAPPPDLANAAIGYDGTHKNIVLLARIGKYDVETWTWDGQTWSRQHPSSVPPATVTYEMGWDEATEQLVLVDLVPSPMRPQTWIWNGSNWERKA